MGVLAVRPTTAVLPASAEGEDRQRDKVVP